MSVLVPGTRFRFFVGIGRALSGIVFVVGKKTRLPSPEYTVSLCMFCDGWVQGVGDVHERFGAVANAAMFGPAVKASSSVCTSLFQAGADGKQRVPKAWVLRLEFAGNDHDFGKVFLL